MFNREAKAELKQQNQNLQNKVQMYQAMIREVRCKNNIWDNKIFNIKMK